MDANNNFEQNQVLLAVANALNHQINRDRLWGRVTKIAILLFFIFIVWKITSLGDEPGAVTSQSEPHVALINIEGEIFAESPANADDIVTGIRRAFEAESAKAVLLRVNSPGGSPTQANFVHDEIMRLRKAHPEKKVYAAITDVGASAAYNIVSAADLIYADRSSIVGSIGVLMVSYGYVDLMKKVGVDDRTITSGEHKTMYSPTLPIKLEDKAHLEKVAAVSHQHFIQAVKDGRGARLVNDPNLFTGMFWTGEQALALGLIDGLASPGTVAREIIGIDNVQDYTIQPNFIEQLGMRLNAKVSTMIHSLMSDKPQLVSKLS